MERKTYFADVILPLPLYGAFTYRIPHKMAGQVETGQRVLVQFGKKKIYTALVVNVHEYPPAAYDVKYILSVLDIKPIVNDIQLKFWNWISEYYMCGLGEVMNVALPSSFKLASETRIKMHPGFKTGNHILSEKEEFIIQALENQKKITITEASEIAGQLKVIPLINTMIDKQIIITEEELLDTYRPRIQTIVELSTYYTEQEERLKELLDTLGKRAHRQLELVMSYLYLKQQSNEDIARPELLKKAGASAAQLNALVDKEVFVLKEKEISRLEYSGKEQSPDDIKLTENQQTALDEIKHEIKAKKRVLLHGVTSSGKTELYIKLIEEVLKQKKQVLYLLPEIALTTQIIKRLQKYFGEKIGVYHSRYNRNEKVEIWNKVLQNDTKTGKFKVILGPRSALFLPFSNLGLIIVDEEHDQSFKQYDPAPRYHARDSAVFLGGLHKSGVILGSATPSLESYFNAKTEKYGLVEVNERYGGICMPEIIVANIRKETRLKTMKSHFSSLLLDHIKRSLSDNKQVILFQNRRGFSLRLECEICGYIPQCKSCDVTLIYHKKSNHLRCHYCGWTSRIPSQCPSCGHPGILMKGFGTEKVEDELSILFPDTRITRMDLDTTRKKHAYRQIIDDFEKQKIDILVGTQMVTKGLDFDNVSLVGILNADNMLSYPDFRALEKSYQLMSQVSGRAGRKGKRGKVIIQAFNPAHYIINDVINHDYKAMYNAQIIERRNYKYPPFYRLILIKLKHKDPELLNRAARVYADMLRQQFGKRVLGPEFPLVSRIRNQYIKTVLLKLERTVTLRKMKQDLSDKTFEFKKLHDFKSVRLQLDVDPV